MGQETPVTNTSPDSPSLTERAASSRLRIWERWWFVSVIVLILSAILVIGGFLGYYLTGGRFADRNTLTIPLQLAQGEGEKVGDALQIEKLSARGMAFAGSPRMRLPAQSFPVLEWHIEGIQPGTEMLFSWITSTAPRTTRTIPITDAGSGKGEIRLDNHPYWNQIVLGTGLLVRGNLQRPLTIHRLALKPGTPTASILLRQLWAEWTAFEGWSMKSVNFIVGGTRGGLFSPVLAAAIWVCLSALLYGRLVLVRQQKWDIKPFALFLLAGWLILDVRWQVNLWRQLSITHEQFAGKTWEEKRSVAEDGRLFQFIQEIEARLPDEPARIFLVVTQPEVTSRYVHLRTRYHLLPHNISSLLTHPPNPSYTHSGDYILFLYPIQDVKYDAERQVLRWDKETELEVKPILNSRTGALFQIL